jgi:phosphohistidine phosphatase
MKRLYLVRHAKAGGRDTPTPDFERPLNRRGERDVPMIGERLARRAVRPDRLVASGAVRAMSTARALADVLKYDVKTIDEDNRIYAADAGDLLALVRGLRNDWESVMLVGHNPAITDLVNALTDEIIENVPTCGVLEIIFDADDWTRIEVGAGRLAAFDYPKNGE